MVLEPITKLLGNIKCPLKNQVGSNRFIRCLNSFRNVVCFFTADFHKVRLSVSTQTRSVKADTVSVNSLEAKQANSFNKVNTHNLRVYLNP